MSVPHNNTIEPQTTAQEPITAGQTLRQQPEQEQSTKMENSTTDSEFRAWLATNPRRPFPIGRLPEPVILQILSSLDLPDLASVGATGSGWLASLSRDAVLHRARLRAVGPRCLAPHLQRRPSLLDLARSGKLKGLNLESKIRRGSYLASPHAVSILETSTRLHRLLIRHKLNRLLAQRPAIRSRLLALNLIDKEILVCSNILAPVLHRLKRQQARDLLARKLRYQAVLLPADSS